MTYLTYLNVRHAIVLVMSEKKLTTPKPKFDKQAYIKSAEKVAKIIQKEQAAQQNAQ